MLTLACNKPSKFTSVINHCHGNFSDAKFCTYNSRTYTISPQLKKDLISVRPKGLHDEIDLKSIKSILSSKEFYNLSVELSKGKYFRKIALAFLFERAIEEGRPDAYNDIGSLIMDDSSELNQDQKTDPKIAIKIFKEAVKLGNANAAMNLGYHYLSGEKIEQNIAKSIHYYKRAEKLGHEEARPCLNYIEEFILDSSEPDLMAKFRLSNPLNQMPDISWLNNVNE